MFLLFRSGSEGALGNPAKGGDGLAGEACMLAPTAATGIEGGLAEGQVQPAQVRADHAQVLAEIPRHDGHMIGNNDLS